MDFYIRAFLVLLGLLLTLVGVLAPLFYDDYRTRLRLWLAVIGIGLMLVILSIVYPSLVSKPTSEETAESYGMKNDTNYIGYLVSK